MFRNTTNQIVKQKTPHLRTHSHALASFCWCKVKFYFQFLGLESLGFLLKVLYTVYDISRICKKW